MGKLVKLNELRPEDWGTIPGSTVDHLPALSLLHTLGQQHRELDRCLLLCEISPEDPCAQGPCAPTATSSLICCTLPATMQCWTLSELLEFTTEGERSERALGKRKKRETRKKNMSNQVELHLLSQDIAVHGGGFIQTSKI
ncbi:hypothetical protein H920_03347 [Fukomys damarensis]|uniref:Uncharacterized protein n=1 Tax=Fukomys damarensis TaxID=885580 RepID=A0A091DVX8_FUKDA|nr:hypothetical protein H920_03347 [Fukomys damarensis]